MTCTLAMIMRVESRRCSRLESITVRRSGDGRQPSEFSQQVAAGFLVDMGQLRA